jgi:hypothetical protein
MNFTFNNSYHLVSTMTTVISWCIIAFLFLRYYKQSEKPPIWKAIIIMLVGMFSFRFNFNTISIPILPLGVWIAYRILIRNGQDARWQRYRKFAWLGFIANFIFLFTSLLIGPIQQLVYPANQLSTFIAYTEQAKVVTTHPSGNEGTLKSNNLLKVIESGKKAENDGEQWYYDTVMTDEERIAIDEKFPYQLIGAKPKWGSGLQAVIFIEQDGKGLLISTPKEQLYYRLTDSIIEVEEGM